MLQKLFKVQHKERSFYYAMFEGTYPSHDEKWFIGVVKVVGTQDSLRTRLAAVRRARAFTNCKHGYRYRPKLITEKEYKCYELCAM